MRGFLDGQDLTGCLLVLVVSRQWSVAGSEETDVFQLDQRTTRYGSLVTNLRPAVRLPLE